MMKKSKIQSSKGRENSSVGAKALQRPQLPPYMRHRMITFVNDLILKELFEDFYLQIYNAYGMALKLAASSVRMVLMVSLFSSPENPLTSIDRT